MPTINARDLGLTPQEAKAMFTGLNRNEAIAKISQLQAEQKQKKESEATSALVNEMSQAGLSSDEISKAVSSTSGLDQMTRESVLRSFLSNNSPSKPTEMGIEAGQKASEILNEFNKGEGRLAVGGSRMPFGWIAGMIPGTESSDFTKKVDTLKSKLSLDAAKYLKGSGQVSDAERKMLSEAVSNLSLSQSEGEFAKSLQEIIDRLNPKNRQDQVTSGETSNGIKFTIQP